MLAVVLKLIHIREPEILIYVYYLIKILVWSLCEVFFSIDNMPIHGIFSYAMVITKIEIQLYTYYDHLSVHFIVW